MRNTLNVTIWDSHVEEADEGAATRYYLICFNHEKQKF